MNIFHLHEDPEICAYWHIDKHIVKMPTEYAQLLSTAHRMLDGEFYILEKKDKLGRTRKVQRWRMMDNREEGIFHACHYNHPSTIWTRSSKENYEFLFNLYKASLKEYTNRYGKEHGSGRPLPYLATAPTNIPSQGLQEMPQAMKMYPECMVPNDPILAYRNYYNVAKHQFAKWKHNDPPPWFTPGQLCTH